MEENEFSFPFTLSCSLCLLPNFQVFFPQQLSFHLHKTWSESNKQSLSEVTFNLKEKKYFVLNFENWVLVLFCFSTSSYSLKIIKPFLKFFIKDFKVWNLYANHCSSWNEFLGQSLYWKCWWDVSHPSIQCVTLISAWTNNEVGHLDKESCFICHKRQLGKAWVCKCEGKTSSRARKSSNSGKKKNPI